jgi:hypothetical protein
MRDVSGSAVRSKDLGRRTTKTPPPTSPRVHAAKVAPLTKEVSHTKSSWVRYPRQSCGTVPS